MLDFPGTICLFSILLHSLRFRFSAFILVCLSLFGMKMNQNKHDIFPADPQNSYFKQDVPNIILSLREKLKKEKPVEPNIHLVLMNSKTGNLASVKNGIQLNYKFTLLAAEGPSNHDYCRNKLFATDIMNINSAKFNKYTSILMKDMYIRSLRYVHCDTEDVNLDLVSQIIQENTHELF